MDEVLQPVRKKKIPKGATKSTSASKADSKQPVQPSPTQQIPPQILPDDRSRQVLAALLAFSDGDFTTRLPTGWSGTEGRIAEAFNHTIANAARITDEAARLSATVGKEGRLSQRMSSPGAAGSWATQVDSLNTLIDDLVRPTTDIARTIGAVAKGERGPVRRKSDAARRSR